MTTPFKLSAPAIKQIKAKWLAGVHPDDLAAEYDVTPQAIRYQIKGLVRENMPGMGRPRSFDHAKAVQLRHEGFTLAVIAARFGVSVSRICQVIKEADRSALARMEWKAAA